MTIFNAKSNVLPKCVIDIKQVIYEFRKGNISFIIGKQQRNR